tara:strand:- start:6395 stop:6709 length:315 start_codon:yes stop_codon:yes gene_type:complete
MNNKSSDYSFNPYKDTLLSHQFDRLFLLITTETATNLHWQLPAWENGILVKPKKAIKFKSGTTLYKDAIYLAYKEDNDQYIIYDPISGWKVGINSDKLSILPVD